MQPHEERVVTEKRELDEKLAKLKAFCFDPGSPVFKELSPVDRDLLEDQYNSMKDYSEILGKRIDRFGKGSDPNWEPPDPPGWEGGFAENH